MTPISLYEGCFVKTADGEVCGPLTENLHGFGMALNTWSAQGLGREIQDRWPIHVIEVYPSLSAASAANPEM